MAVEMSRPNIEELLAKANVFARAEILVALREPQRKIVTLLKNRSVDLDDFERSINELPQVNDPLWGTW